MIALSLSVGACGVQPHGDAGVETQGPEPREYNVGSSGNDTCPGELFNAASYGRATCGSAPQRCVSVPASTSRVICTCDGAMGAEGTWSCREDRN